MSLPITVISAHDFLYSDRHEKLYPDIRVYLEGSIERLEPLIDMLRDGTSALEICQSLKLKLRGDVWFAQFLIYLHMRDGIVSIPDLQLEPPPELASRMEKLEADWSKRSDPPPPIPERPPHEPYAYRMTIDDLEREIRHAEAFLENDPDNKAIRRILEKRRRQLTERTGPRGE